jgi:hypothetical protein
VARELVLGARFLAGLPAFLRHPVSSREARIALVRRLAHREADFLALVRRAVYERGLSPYRDLLRHAGCEYGDLERLVRADGIEGTLRRLLAEGVYLTLEEFKGRRPVVRSGRTIPFAPTALWSLGSGSRLLKRSGGSTGVPVSVPLNFTSSRDDALDLTLFLEARALTEAETALWMVPGGSGIEVLLRFAGAGVRVARWFSPVDPAAPSLHGRYRWSLVGLRAMSGLAGRPFPALEPGPTGDPGPLLRWMAETLRQRRKVPHLWAMAHAGVRLGRAAKDAGVDLAGAHVTLGSEAVTPARVEALRAAGAEVRTRYSSSECGPIGLGCLAPTVVDDVHLLTDRHAIVQSDDRPGTAGTAAPLWVSSLRETARMVLLNVSIGDEGVVERRACGCPLEAFGWTTYLHGIRGLEKLTVGGMALPDACVRAILEEVLPARFGGGPTDYQLVEDEGPDGRPRLRLVIHPAVGPLAAQIVEDACLDAIGFGSGVERLTALAWREARLLQVERRPPLATPLGKVPLVYHQVRRHSSLGEPTDAVGRATTPETGSDNRRARFRPST